jgi:DNA-binding NarL/FixJ family response regulator
MQPEIKVVVLTMLLDRALAEAALHAGAAGFVPKDAGATELRTALKEVLAGRRYVSPRVPKTSHRVGLWARHEGLYRLTPRQEQILLLLGEGKSCSQVSRELGLTPSAITFHKHNLMRTLGIASESDLLHFAVLVESSVHLAKEPGTPT